jgi:hypothetical protein
MAIGGGAVAQEQGPVTAVWQRQELAFSYTSAIAIYTCDALRNRVASILYAVGARPDMEIKVTSCDRANVPMEVTTVDRGPRGIGTVSVTDNVRRTERQQVAVIRVRVSMPVEMTPEVVDELKADKSRRELISRVTANPMPRFDDPVPFTAERRIVTLSYKTIGIEAADCELLDQVVSSTFRTLGVRVLNRGYSCDRNRVSNIRPTLEAEALVAAQLKHSPPQELPPEGDDDAASASPAVRGEEPAAPVSEEPPE